MPEPQNNKRVEVTREALKMLVDISEEFSIIFNELKPLTAEKLFLLKVRKLVDFSLAKFPKETIED